MKYQKYFLLGLVLLLIISTIGCEFNKEELDKGEQNEEGEDTITKEPVKGGQVIVPLTTVDTLNPLKTENESYFHLSKLVYEGLFEFDKDLNVKEQLAETYNIKDGGKTIEIKLRDDILWHDGESLKAEDVAFTIDTIKSADENSPYSEMLIESLGIYGSSNLREIINISVIDSNNLEINFDKPYSNNLEVLTFPIIPKHLFVQGNRNTGGVGNALEIDDYNVIGTGPFKFNSYDKKKQIVLESNDNYRGGEPYIDKIIGKVIGSQEDVSTAFETGQINITTNIGVDWDKYSQNKRIKTLEYISPNYEFLGFNSSKEIFQGEEGKALRKAIAYGIDRQKIIEMIYLGHGTQTDVAVNPNSWLASQEANSYGYNPDKGIKKLNEIGWEDNNGDGLLENSSGKILSLNILANSNNLMRVKTAEMIKEDLLDMGISVNIDFYEGVDNEIERVQDNIINRKITSGEFDMVLLGWELSPIPDLSFAFHSSRVGSSTNFIRYSNVEMDKVLEEAFIKGTREGKIKAYEKIQQVLVDDLPYVSLFFENKALLSDNKIVGRLDPNYLNPYNSLKNCYIPIELQ